MKKRRFLTAALCFLLLCFFALPVSAVAEGRGVEAEGEAIGEDWERFLDTVPDEVRELLPADFFGSDMEAVGESVREAGAFSSILRTVLRLCGIAIKENLALLASITGVLILAATLGAFFEKKGGVSRTFEFAVSLTTAVLFFTLCATRFGDIAAYFKTVGAISLAILPLMGVLYAMGGNIAAAVANHGVMSAFLVVLEKVFATSVVPVAALCLVLALVEAVSGNISLRALTTLVRRTFTWGISLLMLILSFVLGVQQTLAKGADTLALRTVRFAAGSFLPVVGGSVGESLRTVAGSVEYLRATVGMGGVLVLFFAFLPMFLSVLFTRITLLLGGAVAGMLSLPREERLLGEFASVFGYFLAIIAALFVMTFVSLTLMAHCAAAVG